MAASNERQEKRRRRIRIGGTVAALVVVCGAVGGVLVWRSSSPKTPVADASKSPTAKSTGSSKPGTTLQGPQTVGTLPASKGSLALGLGADAKPATAPDIQGQVLKLPSGQNSFAQTSRPVVDTNGSFTVSARVLSDVPTGSRSAVSQGDGGFCSFSMGRGTNPAGHNVWDFKVQVPGGGSRTAYSNGDVAVGQWAVLTGVYDASLKQIKFYVNGAAQASVPVPGVQDSGSGLFQVGRASLNYQWTDLWHGAVTDIQVWNQALSDADIVKIAAGPSTPPEAPPTAAWLTG